MYKQNTNIIIGKSLFKIEKYEDNLEKYKLFNIIKKRNIKIQ